MTSIDLGDLGDLLSSGACPGPEPEQGEVPGSPGGGEQTGSWHCLKQITAIQTFTHYLDWISLQEITAIQIFTLYLGWISLQESTAIQTFTLYLG